MCCLFSAGENLSNISRGRDLGRNGVVGCDHQFACRLMDSASSTEPHIVQVLLPYHCKQIEHIILRCLRCTLPASPSYPAHETRARTHTHTLHASSRQCTPTVCPQGSSSVSRISLPLFDGKPSKYARTQRHQKCNFSLASIPPHIFFDRKKFAKANSNGSRSKFLFKTAFWALLRRFTPETRTRRLLTPWNDLLYSSRPFQNNCSFSASRSFVLGQTRPRTDFQ